MSKPEQQDHEEYAPIGRAECQCCGARLIAQKQHTLSQCLTNLRYRVESLERGKKDRKVWAGL